MEVNVIKSHRRISSNPIVIDTGSPSTVIFSYRHFTKRGLWTRGGCGWALSNDGVRKRVSARPQT
jgi:hypothetical protein